MSVSGTVTPSRRHSSPEMATPGRLNSSPKSSVAKPLIQIQYCSGQDLSRPHLARNFSMAASTPPLSATPSAVMSVTMAAAGSPGVMRMTQKISTVMPNMVGTIHRIRRTM